MSDLDKIMNKIAKEKEVKEDPTPEIEDEDEDEDDFEDLEEEVPEIEPKKVEKKKVVKKLPEEKEEEIEEKVKEAQDVPVLPEQTIEGEVGVLQNNGVFRRELLVTLQEQNTVLKAIAEILLQHGKKSK